MNVTVAVCTHNPDLATLKRALGAIVAVLADEPSAELLVIDNNSDPALDLGRLGFEQHGRVVREPVPGLTAAREAAFRTATGDVIVFVDDDNVLAHDYLDIVRAAFEADARLGALGAGRILPEYEAAPPAWFGWEFEEWLAVRRLEPDAYIEFSKPDLSGFPVGAGLAVRTEIGRAYQEDCQRTARIEGRRGAALSSGEDLDLGLYAVSEGYKVAVSGALGLTHIISADRLTASYIERLAVSKVRSSRELEDKWAPRFGVPIYPMLHMPLPEACGKALVTRALGLWSPKYRVKSRIFSSLAKARAGRPI